MIQKALKLGRWQAETKREAPGLLCEDLLVEFHKVLGLPVCNILMLTSGTKVGSNTEMMNDHRNLRSAVNTEEGWAICHTEKNVLS